MSVAKTILEQLGGRRFVVMTGSKDFVGSNNSLTMRLTKNKSGANKLRITLTPADTYTMEFMKFSPKHLTVTTVTTREGVYCDNLQEVFTDVTGLYTRF